MEREIGEIFEYNGEWYQCVQNDRVSCEDCDFTEYCESYSGSCDSTSRKDGNGICFKKLEKRGEPVKINGALMQKMKTPVAIGCEQCVLNNKSCCFIDSKCFSNELYVIIQNQENMEDKKLNLKPFDLEAAKAGKPVCTRDGRKARIICFDLKNDEYPIVAAVGNDSSETLFSYTTNGEIADGIESDKDLMMLPEKKEGWVNVYKGGLLDTKSYPTKKEAFDKASPKDYVDTIKINWSE